MFEHDFDNQFERLLTNGQTNGDPQVQRAGALLRLIAAAPVPQPPADLTARVMSRIRASDAFDASLDSAIAAGPSGSPTPADDAPSEADAADRWLRVIGSLPSQSVPDGLASRVQARLAAAEQFDQQVDQAIAGGPHGRGTAGEPGSPAAAAASWLALIGSHKAPEPSTHLASRVTQHIATHELAELGASREQRALAGEPQPIRFPGRWLLRPNILAAAASIVVLVGVLVPSVMYLRAQAHRDACANNLAELARGITEHRAATDQLLPRAPAIAGANWGWTAFSDEPVQPNTRHPFQLLKQGLVDPKHFVSCAEPDDKPISVDQAQLAKLDNFQSPNQISYSFQVMHGGQPDAQLPTRMAVMSNRSPMCETGRCPKGYLHATDGNSHAYEGRGQNVLYLDGHVSFEKTPNVGVNGDNIWSPSSNTKALTGTELPEHGNDSFLVP